MSASRVDAPVASTTASAAPDVMYVPAKTRSPTPICTGTLSPVRVDASTARPSADAIARSAGTLSPGERTTTSPTTRFAASTVVGCPSRRTTTPSGKRSCSFAAALSARCSCTNANTPFTTMTMKMAIPSCGIDAINDITPATHSMSAKKWVNWPTSFRQTRAAGRAGNRFGPSAISRAAASADVSPVVARVGLTCCGLHSTCRHASFAVRASRGVLTVSSLSEPSRIRLCWYTSAASVR